MAELWTLKISSWAGISFNAEHHYGVLETNTKRYRLHQIMTPEYAAELTAKDSTFTWRAGTGTDRFKTREEVIEVAWQAFQAYGGEGDALVHGDGSIPYGGCIDGPFDFKTLTNLVVFAGNHLNWYDDGPKEVYLEDMGYNFWVNRRESVDALYNHYRLLLKHNGYEHDYNVRPEEEDLFWDWGTKFFIEEDYSYEDDDFVAVVPLDNLQVPE